jgi:hypothetical protein
MAGHVRKHEDLFPPDLEDWFGFFEYPLEAPESVSSVKEYILFFGHGGMMGFAAVGAKVWLRNLPLQRI